MRKKWTRSSFCLDITTRFVRRREKETDRQTEGQTDRQADMEEGIQTETNTHTDRQREEGERKEALHKYDSSQTKKAIVSDSQCKTD